jgi:hypothetical protein
VSGLRSDASTTTNDLGTVTSDAANCRGSNCDNAIQVPAGAITVDDDQIVLSDDFMPLTDDIGTVPTDISQLQTAAITLTNDEGAADTAPAGARARSAPAGRGYCWWPVHRRR